MRAFIGILIAVVWSIAPAPAKERTFTVRDSIEMTRFLRESPKVEFSPDGRYFAIVTSRGVLQSNSIESTLWVFSSAQVRTFLRAGNAAKAPAPHIAARITAVPRTDYSNSYEPVIFALQWLRDSKVMFFQVEGARGERRLYRVDLISGSVRALTPSGYDVTQFAPTPTGVVYEATPPSVAGKIGEPINADATDVTGLSMESILFPQTVDTTQNPYNELWNIRDGTVQRIIGNARVANASFSDTLAPAPDGHAAVVVVPVESIPLSWAEYEPALPYMRIKPQDPATIAPTNWFRPVQYALVDLTSGKVKPLVNAPNGRAAGSAHTSGAAWSPSGARVLLMNTFLPREGVNAAERARRVYPCLGAVVEMHSQAMNCVAFGSYDYQSGKSGSDFLLGGSFGKTDADIVLHMFVLPNTRINRYYHEEDESWNLVNSSIPGNAIASALSVAVRQDINTPPALWVTDLQSHVSKKLWDPNPQLALMRLGQASVLRWKDASGYEWVAGLVKPPNYVAGKRYPLVIQTHGFDPDEFLSDGSFTTAFAARPLASAGIIVLQMPDSHAHLVSLQEIPDQLRGFESAIALLNAKGLIDPKRVGIIGFSRTCYHVEGALIAKPKLFAAASITDGVDESYMQYLLFGVGDNVREQEQIYGATPFGAGLQVWAKEVPGFNLYRVHTPLLIGTIGPASVLEEWEIYASLRMQKKPVDMLYIPNGQHILQKPLDRLASQQNNVDWFRFWLQGYEDPDPAKAAQYKRWKTLQ